MRRAWVIVKTLFRNIWRDDIGGLAAQMSFAYLFSVFPFLICLYLLLSWIGRSTAALPWLLERLGRYMPAESLEAIRVNFDAIAANFSSKVFTFSSLFMLYTVALGFQVAMRAFDRMLAVPPEQQRGFFKLNALSYGMAVFSIVAVIISFNLSVLGQRVVKEIIEAVGLYGVTAFVLHHLRLPIAFLLTFLSVAAIYRVSPSVSVRLRHIVPGALVFSVLWLAMTRGFGLYLSRFALYQQVYGALSGIIILLVWFYAGSVIFLIGGEVSAALRDLDAEKEQAAASSATA